MGIPTSPIDITTAARDAATLATLGTYQLKLLAKQLGLNNSPDKFAAFVAAPREQQAATLAAALASYDAAHGGAPPPAHVPVIAQQQPGALPPVGAPPAPLMNAQTTPPAPVPPAVGEAAAPLPARRNPRRAAAAAPAAGAPAPGAAAPMVAPGLPAAAATAPAPSQGGAQVGLQTSDVLRIHARLEETAKAVERLTTLVDTVARVEGGQRTFMQMFRRMALANFLIAERLGVQVDDLIEEALATPPDFVDAFFMAAGTPETPAAGKAG